MARQQNDGRGRLGGRQKGTPNKTTAGIRDIIAQHWDQYHQSGQFKKDLDSLLPHERAVIMEKYAQYIVPKMKSMDIEMELNHKSTLTLEAKLRHLYEEEKD